MTRHLQGLHLMLCVHFLRPRQRTQCLAKQVMLVFGLLSFSFFTKNTYSMGMGNEWEQGEGGGTKWGRGGGRRGREEGAGRRGKQEGAAGRDWSPQGQSPGLECSHLPTTGSLSFLLRLRSAVGWLVLQQGMHPWPEPQPIGRSPRGQRCRAPAV